MFKKSSKPKANVRRRSTAEDADDEAEGFARETSATNLGPSASAPSPAGPARPGPSAVGSAAGPSRRPGEGVLEFSSSALRQREAEGRAAADGAAVQSRFAFQSNREVQVHSDQRATATLETETEFDRDARAIREKVLKRAEEALKGNRNSDSGSGGGSGGGSSSGTGEKKVYQGIAGYKDHTAGFRREHTVGSEKATGAHGPLRASAHIRWSVRFDYQPDICKDYKETGYCGYGDSCKFLHDRGDYKSGWQLEREWDEKEKRRKAAIAMGASGEGGGEGVEEGEEEDEDELPFACFICRQPFVDPVVTKCRHYFCEHCALKHNAKNKNCYVCNKPTQGVFNTAHEIIRKQKEEQQKKKKQKVEEKGEADEDE